MFGSRFFGPRFFGVRYFGRMSAAAVPAVPAVFGFGAKERIGSLVAKVTIGKR